MSKLYTNHNQHSNNNKKNEYILTFAKESEVSSWLEFVSRCFNASSNPTPVTAFCRHLVNDVTFSWADESICVVRDSLPPHNFIAAVRVFQRRSYINNNIYNYYGLGDVCVNPDFQNQGYARVILNYTLDYIKKLNEIKTTSEDKKECIIALQCAPALQGLYSKVGFRSVNSVDAYFKLKLLNADGNNQFTFNELVTSDFNDIIVIEQLNELYNSFAAQLNGTLVRNTEYWSRWLKGEYSGSYNINYTDSKQDNVEPITRGMKLFTIKHENKLFGYMIIHLINKSDIKQQQALPYDSTQLKDPNNLILNIHEFITDIKQARREIHQSALLAALQYSVKEFAKIFNPAEFDAQKLNLFKIAYPSLYYYYNTNIHFAFDAEKKIDHQDINEFINDSVELLYCKCRRGVMYKSLDDHTNLLQSLATDDTNRHALFKLDFY
jgi:GNAT superfamily N-acetyltransferase